MDSQFYERTALSRNKAAMLRKGAKPQPGDAVSADEEIRHPLVLEFLGLRDEYSESDLEDALIRHLETFLLELGNDFAFVGRQRRLRIDDEWYRVDLLFMVSWLCLAPPDKAASGKWQRLLDAAQIATASVDDCDAGSCHRRSDRAARSGRQCSFGGWHADLARIDGERRTQRAGEGLEQGFQNVVGILPVAYFHVQVAQSSRGEAREKLARQLGIEAAHPTALERVGLVHERRATGKRKCLIPCGTTGLQPKRVLNGYLVWQTRGPR
jgi:hypothetical protein